MVNRALMLDPLVFTKEAYHDSVAKQRFVNHSMEVSDSCMAEKDTFVWNNETQSVIDTFRYPTTVSQWWQYSQLFPVSHVVTKVLMGSQLVFLYGCSAPLDVVEESFCIDARAEGTYSGGVVYSSVGIKVHPE